MRKVTKWTIYRTDENPWRNEDTIKADMRERLRIKIINASHIPLPESFCIQMDLVAPKGLSGASVAFVSSTIRYAASMFSEPVEIVFSDAK